MDCSVDNETLLVLRCIGLTVPPKTNFKNVGVFSNIFLMATGTKHATNEKRIVKLSLSESFRPNGRPPNSDFALIYSSEVLEDSTDATPSLVASIRCPPELDCMIRLSVYYSSNLTGEKEVLLAGTSFTRKELVRAAHSKGILVSDMISEHCPGSKAYIEIMDHMPNVLPDIATVLPSAHPDATQLAASTATGFNITAPRTPVNPFKQRYVFYSEQDHTSQLVSAEESTWEPRHSALIPALFMENFTSALVRSINAWNMRYELERKRQGRFRSLKEALAHGWHSVNVTVHGARIGSSRAQTDRLRQQVLQQEAAAAAAVQSGDNGGSIGGGGGGGADNRSSRRISSNYSAHSQRPMSMALGGHSAAAACQAGGTGPPLPVYNVCIPIPSSGDPLYVDPKVPVAGAGAGSGGGAGGSSSGGGSRRVLHDESAPCTFVDISIQDSSQMFLLPLGRTNTEYHTLNPQYGSNINAQANRKAAVAAVASSDCVEIFLAEREFEFYSYDTTDRDAVNRWHHQYQQTHRLQQQQQKHQGRSNPADLSFSTASTTERSHSHSAGSSSSSSSSSAGITSSSNSSSNSGGSSSHSGSISGGGGGGRDGNQHQQHLSATLQSALLPLPAPLPPADSIHRVTGREAHFYRFISSCTPDTAAILFEVCLEDPSSGAKRRIGTCTLPLSPALREDVWLPVKVTAGGSADGVADFEDIEIRVSVSVKSPEEAVNNNPGEVAARSNLVHHDFLSDKPSPAAMPEVFMYHRSIQGQPEKKKESSSFSGAGGSCGDGGGGGKMGSARVRAVSADSIAVGDHITTTTGGLNSPSFPTAAPTRQISDDSASASTLAAAAAGGKSSPGGGGERWVSWSTASDSKLSELSDYRATLANAYEWMWFAGFTGIDPLVLEDSPTVAAAVAAAGTVKYAQHSPRSPSGLGAAVGAGAGGHPPLASVHGNRSEDRNNFATHTTKDRSDHRAVSTEGALGGGGGGGGCVRGSSGGGGGGHGGDDTAEADAAEDQEVEVEDFQAHFETGRMSVFEYAPSSIDDLLDLHGEEDPLSETALDLPADADDGDVAGAGELALDPSPAAVVTKQPFSSVTQPVFAHPLSVEPPEPPAESPSTEVDAQSGAETAMPPTPVSAATVPSSAPPGCSSKSTSARYVKRSRVDYSYPLEWIRSHVTAMEALAVELGSQVPHLKQVHRENRSFRASAFKKQAEWQALPVNLHYQLMAVRPHDHTPFTTAAARDAKAKPFTEVIHSVTCGAMTPHMLGHKNGGLYHQESKLVASKVELDKTKQLFADRVRQAGYTKIPPTPAEPFGVYKRLTEIGEKTLKFESLCLSICHRRAYAISQSLSIAVNALLLKLGLCMQGVVPERVCEQWMQCGVLLVFEGLLSVVAHERSMLEDTISAVDALRSFQVRLLPYPDEMHLFEAPPAAETSGEDSAGSTTSTADLPPPPPPPPRPASRSLSRPSSSGVVTALSASTSDTNLNLGSAGSSPTQEIVTTTSAAAAACATSETQPKDDDEGAPSGLSTPPAPAAAPAKPRRPLSISPKPISVPLDGELDLGDININLNINLNLPSFTSPVPSAGPAGTAAGSKGDSTGATPPLPPPQTPPRNLKLELKGREVVIYVPAASLRKLPKQYQLAAYTKGGAVVPFYPVLFTQGIDIQQTMVTTFGGDSSQGRTHNLHLQHDVNLKGLRDVNAYCMKALPVRDDPATHRIHPSGNNKNTTLSPQSYRKRLSTGTASASTTHPMVKTLHDTILSSSLALKNVDLLIEVERLSVMLGGCRITFCKSGKDRTGMACTLEQSRQLGERYGCGMSVPRVLKDANLMRVHGCRLLIAEKNIGRKVYSINKLQAQFLPVMFRPPNQVCEDLLKKDNS